MFANAARGVPRQINNYVRNAATLVVGRRDRPRARRRGRRRAQPTTRTASRSTCSARWCSCSSAASAPTPDGDAYQASVSTLATAIGKSRDTKAIVLRVEPYLIEQGYLQVGHGGRKLTPRASSAPVN
jgi:hypothetical protein